MSVRPEEMEPTPEPRYRVCSLDRYEGGAAYWNVDHDSITADRFDSLYPILAGMVRYCRIGGEPVLFGPCHRVERIS